ncbi:MAG TPA: hypothetical protein VK471_12790 [Solirubrobacterales bacterium]|nr:hypothetical protein [Solirubrobacterales bacterium]
MKRTPGTFAAIAIAMLAIAPLATGEEQTRDSYKAQVEPICAANRSANEKIMAGARDRVNKGKLVPAGKQFVRASGSVAGLIKQLATVPAPSADERRIEHWLGSIQLLKQRLREVGKYYKAGEKIKAAHTSILAERAGLSANNTSIVFHFHYCRFSHIGG